MILNKNTALFLQKLLASYDLKKIIKTGKVSKEDAATIQRLYTLLQLGSNNIHATDKKGKELSSAEIKELFGTYSIDGTEALPGLIGEKTGSMPMEDILRQSDPSHDNIGNILSGPNFAEISKYDAAASSGVPKNVTKFKNLASSGPFTELYSRKIAAYQQLNNIRAENRANFSNPLNWFKYPISSIQGFFQNTAMAKTGGLFGGGEASETKRKIRQQIVDYRNRIGFGDRLRKEGLASAFLPGGTMPLIGGVLGNLARRSDTLSGIMDNPALRTMANIAFPMAKPGKQFGGDLKLNDIDEHGNIRPHEKRKIGKSQRSGIQRMQEAMASNRNVLSRMVNDSQKTSSDGDNNISEPRTHAISRIKNRPPRNTRVIASESIDDDGNPVTDHKAPDNAIIKQLKKEEDVLKKIEKGIEDLKDPNSKNSLIGGLLGMFGKIGMTLGAGFLARMGITGGIGAAASSGLGVPIIASVAALGTSAAILGHEMTSNQEIAANPNTDATQRRIARYRRDLASGAAIGMDPASAALGAQLPFLFDRSDDSDNRVAPAPGRMVTATTELRRLSPAPGTQSIPEYSPTNRQPLSSVTAPVAPVVINSQGGGESTDKNYSQIPLIGNRIYQTTPQPLNAMD